MTTTTRPPVRGKKLTTVPPVESDGTTEVQPGLFEVPDEEEGSRIEERPPVVPAPTLSDRVGSVRESTQKLRSLPNRLRSVGGKTTVKRSRTSVEGLISAVWGIGARIVQPVAWPVSNVLTLQSPVAGAILEDAIKNTVVDTVLQPFARFGQGSQVAFALLGPPVLVGIATANPNSQPIVEPLLREALRTWLMVAGPKMIERAEKEAEFQAEYGQTIDQMIKAIFTPPAGMVLPEESTGNVTA